MHVRSGFDDESQHDEKSLLSICFSSKREKPGRPGDPQANIRDLLPSLQVQTKKCAIKCANGRNDQPWSDSGCHSGGGK
jgi:hypothetical protein